MNIPHSDQGFERKLGQANLVINVISRHPVFQEGSGRDFLARSTRSPYVALPWPPIFFRNRQSGDPVESLPKPQGHEAMSLVKRSTGGHLMSGRQTRTRTRTKVKPKTERPKLYKVILIQ